MAVFRGEEVINPYALGFGECFLYFAINGVIIVHLCLYMVNVKS